MRQALRGKNSCGGYDTGSCCSDDGDNDDNCLSPQAPVHHFIIHHRSQQGNYQWSLAGHIISRWIIKAVIANTNTYILTFIFLPFFTWGNASLIISLHMRVRSSVGSRNTTATSLVMVVREGFAILLLLVFLFISSSY